MLAVSYFPYIHDHVHDPTEVSLNIVLPFSIAENAQILNANSPEMSIQIIFATRRTINQRKMTIVALSSS